MNESLGGSGLFYILIIIVSALLLLLLGFLSFSKAFKVKNHIINIIHENRGDISQSYTDIESDLYSVGYSSNKMKSCNETDLYNKLIDLKENNNRTVQNCCDAVSVVIPDASLDKNTSFDYCVYKYIFADGSYYYSVVTYVHMNIPLVESVLHIPITGETKIFERKYED